MVRLVIRDGADLGQGGRVGSVVGGPLFGGLGGLGLVRGMVGGRGGLLKYAGGLALPIDIALGTCFVGLGIVEGLAQRILRNPVISVVVVVDVVQIGAEKEIGPLAGN